MTIRIDSALHGPESRIADLIAQSGHADSSGLRRMLIESLRDRKIGPFQRLCNMDQQQFDALRRHFVEAYGEPA